MVVLGRGADHAAELLRHGLNWAEPLLGMALLWLTMLGALAAAGWGGTSPSIWPPRCCRAAGQAADARHLVFAAVVCGLLAWAAGRYVGFQREMDICVLLGCRSGSTTWSSPWSSGSWRFRFAVRAFVPMTGSLPATRRLPGEGRVPS